MRIRSLFVEWVDVFLCLDLFLFLGVGVDVGILESHVLEFVCLYLLGINITG